MKKVPFIILLIIVGLVVYFKSSSKVTDNLDTYIYDLPFKEGARYKVVQGYGGRFSHNHKAALDFYMPVGTPVYAARGGVIYRFKDNSNAGGPFPWYTRKANYIIIKHDDGSYGCYWHLQKNGVVVKNGTVTKGQLIGYSGSTGFALVPHLHFAVKKVLGYDEDSYVRTKFRTSKGVVILESGESYMRPIE
jgi:murein DD-endopeptidase MepM/ murein hydrolase activator NlpD